jgi:SNF2 family DNA or RNA helicase
MALFDACVDLNPHQIDAAAFALRNPLSKGVLLADEVGLGKTIEAGLVLCQYRAGTVPGFSPSAKMRVACIS